jgi:CheY-like chemotaxis protein
MDVDVARSHEEGLEKLRIRKYDCIVRTLNQTNRTEGLELSSTLQNLNIDTPVILLSEDNSIEAEDSGSALLVKKDEESSYVTSLATTITRIVSGEDQTDQQAASHTAIKQLQAAVASYEAAFETSEEMMMILSPDGLTVERCTSSLEKLFKPETYMEESFRKIPLVMLTAKKDRQRMRSFIRDLILKNSGSNIFDFAVPGGRATRLRVSGKTVIRDNQISALILKAEKVRNRID